MMPVTGRGLNAARGLGVGYVYSTVVIHGFFWHRMHSTPASQVQPKSMSKMRPKWFPILLLIVLSATAEGKSEFRYMTWCVPFFITGIHSWLLQACICTRLVRYKSVYILIFCKLQSLCSSFDHIDVYWSRLWRSLGGWRRCHHVPRHWPRPYGNDSGLVHNSNSCWTLLSCIWSGWHHTLCTPL